MRLLHTSDWHLGRILHGVHLTEDQAFVLDDLVRLVGDAKLDCVLLSGDVYDRAQPPAEAVELLDEVLTKIVVDLRVPVVVIAGNHDSPERIGFGSRMLRDRGLHLVGPVQRARVVTFEDGHGLLDVLAVPYAPPEAVRALVERDAPPADVDAADAGPMRDHEAALSAVLSRARAESSPGRRSVVLAHAFVQGGATCDSERPLQVGGTGAVSPGLFEGFAYAALGHLHRPQAVVGDRVRYSGSLLKYSFSEAAHDKSVSVVEIDAQGGVSVEAVRLRTRRDLRVVQGMFDEVLRAGRDDPARHDYVNVVLHDDAPVFDAMARLREVYPNALCLERPRLLARLSAERPRVDRERLDEAALFSAFVRAMAGPGGEAGHAAADVDESSTDGALSAAEAEALARAIEAARRRALG